MKMLILSNYVMVKSAFFSSGHTYSQIFDSNKNSVGMVKASGGSFIIDVGNSCDISSNGELMGFASKPIQIWEEATCSLIAVDSKGQPVLGFLPGHIRRNVILWFCSCVLSYSFSLPVVHYYGGLIYHKLQPLKLLYRTNKLVQNRNVTMWVWDPGSIILIIETSFICGLLRAKVFEGEMLCIGGGSEVWSIYHQRFLGYCSLGRLLFSGELLFSWYSRLEWGIQLLTHQFTLLMWGTHFDWMQSL
ncbi:hypothetical protein HanPI659440_Chr13g0500851 [Helianthus annuus]|nr:hypothetical protein HanPI659440_Chr13g0500851 [Helianthus annuus]